MTEAPPTTTHAHARTLHPTPLVPSTYPRIPIHPQAMTWHHDHIGNKAHHPRLFVKCGGDIRREADGTGKMPAFNFAHPGFWVYWMLPEAFLKYGDFTARHVAGCTAGEKGAVTLKLQFPPDASVSVASVCASLSMWRQTLSSSSRASRAAASADVTKKAVEDIFRGTKERSQANLQVSTAPRRWRALREWKEGGLSELSLGVGQTVFWATARR